MKYSLGLLMPNKYDPWDNDDEFIEIRRSELDAKQTASFFYGALAMLIGVTSVFYLIQYLFIK